MKIDVLLNSPGIHDEVRIRRPYEALQRSGVDCIIHERPFRLNQCTRKDSIVVWQRPLPESKEIMLEHLEWFMKRNCILLVDLDDHFEQFNVAQRGKLKQQDYAILRFSHGVITSNSWLAKEFFGYNPIVFTLDNCIGKSQRSNVILNHRPSKGEKIKILIANQNRHKEHLSLIPSLKNWLEEEDNIHLEIINDQALKSALPSKRITHHPLLTYLQYRNLLKTCQIALSPLEKGKKNRCKTVVKWQECTEEGVVLVAGPELYRVTLNNNVGCWVDNTEDIVTKARRIYTNETERINILKNAQQHIHNYGWECTAQSRWHRWLLEKIWQKQDKLNWLVSKRVKMLKGMGLNCKGKLSLKK